MIILPLLLLGAFGLLERRARRREAADAEEGEEQRPGEGQEGQVPPNGAV